MLTPEHKQTFNEDGYVCIENALPEDAFTPVIDEYDGVVDQLAHDLKRHGRIQDLCSNLPFDTRLAALSRQDEATYRQADDLVDIASVLGDATFHFLRHPALLDLMEPILGPEITCSPIQHVRCKLPFDLWDGASSYTAPWHQDAQVHTEEADNRYILTVWIPLVDTDEENGCLHVIPGYHRRERVLWSEGFGISEDNMPDAEPVAVPMQRGDVLLVHKLTPHASYANQTQQIRWSMDLRYQRTGTPSGRSCYPDFVARSRRDPASELVDPEAWRTAWQEALEKHPQKEPRKSRPTTPVDQAVEV